MMSAVAVIIWVDSRTMRIPNAANVALFVSGGIYQAPYGLVYFFDRLMLAAIVFCVFYAARSLHASLSGRLGLGMGDVKLLAGATVWLGVWNFPLFMLVASCGALLYAACSSQLAGGNWRSKRVPFGPFLGSALILVWILDATSLSWHM